MMLGRGGGMSYDPWQYRQRPYQLGSFSTDARTAITTSPDYFVRWYTLKSIGLGVAVGVIGFLLGRATRK